VKQNKKVSFCVLTWMEKRNIKQILPRPQVSPSFLFDLGFQQTPSLNKQPLEAHTKRERNGRLQRGFSDTNQGWHPSTTAGSKALPTWSPSY
jgi:hypothetical protein